MNNIVERIVVEGLHDNYNYDIRFDKEGVTLITGPNGYGKTTILKIIKNAVNLNFEFFEELLFKNIVIYFDEGRGTRLVIEKNVSENDVLLDVKYRFFLSNSKNPTNEYVRNNLLKQFDAFNEKFLKSVIYYRDEFAHRRFDDIPYKKAEEKLSSLIKFLKGKNVLFVKAQRIFDQRSSEASDDGLDADERNHYTIESIAEELKSEYASHKSEYSDKSQKIDSTFVKRLLNKKTPVYDEETYKKVVNSLNNLVEEYKKYGLLENYEFAGKYSKDFAPALSLYIEDMVNKFFVYNGFYQKLSMFDRFVNGKGLSNKRMLLDGENGISFVSDSGREVPLTRLSSGEQNLVILFYRLVFESDRNTLLLVDEPENSLHVEWLSNMLDNYIEMEKLLGCQVVIATHSVPFIDGHWDIAFDLYGGKYQA